MGTIYKQLESILGINYPLNWMMQPYEKVILKELLSNIQPEVAIEIGTKDGGSLQVISQFSKKVYSLDIDEFVPQLESKNIEFIKGDSKKTLPELLNKITHANERLNFVLIDGDHSYNGVKADIENLLNFKPNCEMVVVMHDSFNPKVRNGILDASWYKSEFVQHVELDFVPGQNPQVKTHYNQMWGGLGIAYFSNKPRKGQLEIKRSANEMFIKVYKNSTYNSAFKKILQFKILLKKTLIPVSKAKQRS